MWTCCSPIAPSCCWRWSTSPWKCCGCRREDHSRISFDANDYRLLRIEELRMSAVAAAEKVKRTGEPFRFNPMNSRERRVIHLALRNETAVRSESCGSGPAAPRGGLSGRHGQPARTSAQPEPPRRSCDGPRPQRRGRRVDRRAATVAAGGGRGDRGGRGDARWSARSAALARLWTAPQRAAGNRSGGCSTA